MQTNPNLGWAYFKGYYLEYNWRNERETYNVDYFQRHNERLYRLVLDAYPADLMQVTTPDRPTLHQLSLQTTYPGLVTGTGLSHQTGSKAKGESKLGFTFDPCTGLPYLPGSSVKGALRSSFPQQVNLQKAHKLDPGRMVQNRQLIAHFLADVLACTVEELPQKRDQYLTERGFPEDFLPEVAHDLVDLLEWELFEGIQLVYQVPKHPDAVAQALPKPISVYRRDIFHDAYPAESRQANGQFLGPDFITPHKHPRLKGLDEFAEPVPIQFLKILPETVINFQFDLKDGVLTAGQKLHLISHLLQLKGIGAKTNVGYGRLIEPVEPLRYEVDQEVQGKVVSTPENNYDLDDTDVEVFIEESDLTLVVNVGQKKAKRLQPDEEKTFVVRAVDRNGAITRLKIR